MAIAEPDIEDVVSGMVDEGAVCLLRPLPRGIYHRDNPLLHILYGFDPDSAEPRIAASQSISGNTFSI